MSMIEIASLAETVHCAHYYNVKEGVDSTMACKENWNNIQINGGEQKNRGGGQT